MATKTKDINFTHKGGVEVVTFNALPNVLPLTYKLSEDITWLHIKLENNVIVNNSDEQIADGLENIDLEMQATPYMNIMDDDNFIKSLILARAHTRDFLQTY